MQISVMLNVISLARLSIIKMATSMQAQRPEISSKLISKKPYTRELDQSSDSSVLEFQLSRSFLTEICWLELERENWLVFRFRICSWSKKLRLWEQSHLFRLQETILTSSVELLSLTSIGWTRPHWLLNWETLAITKESTTSLSLIIIVKFSLLLPLTRFVSGMLRTDNSCSEFKYQGYSATALPSCKTENLSFLDGQTAKLELSCLNPASYSMWSTMLTTMDAQL